MRARTGSCLFLILATVLWTKAAWGSGPSETALGWSWDQVKLQPTPAGEMDCAVRGALLQPSEPGEPALPAALIRVQAPEGMSPAGFEIVGEVTSSRDLEAPIAAALKDAPSEAGGPTRVARIEAVDKAPAWPSSRVRYLGISLGRGVPWAQFAVYPIVLENGRRAELLESGTLVVHWQKDPAVPLPLKSLREEVPRDQPRWGGSQVDPAGLGKAPVVTPRPALIGDPVDYVVVTRKNLVSAIQPLVDWKNQSGTPAVVRTVEWIDSTYVGAVDEPARIRTFLIEAYRYWGTKWLLIVGGPNEVPIRACRSYSWACPTGLDIITDSYYAGLDGTWNNDGNSIFGEGVKVECPVHLVGDGADFDPELYVGRVPANGPEQVQIFVQKYLKYAKNPDLGGYLDKFLLLGEVLFDVGWTRARLNDNPPCGLCGTGCDDDCVRVDGAMDCYRVIAEVLNQSSEVALTPIEMYEWYEYWRAAPYNRINAILEKRDDVITKMNEGCAILHHVGHGDRDRMSIGTGSGTDGGGRFLVGDARVMANADRQGILYSINCSSAAIDYDCLAEAMLFCPTGGVVAYIGSSNLDFPAAATGFQLASYSKLFLEPRDTWLGVAFADAITDQTAFWGDRDSYQRFLAFSLILLGDPQTNVWMGTPRPLVVTGPTTMTLGDSTLTVNVTRQGSPLEGALVCAYKANDTWATALSNVSGQAVLKFRPGTTGTFGVTVTHPTSVPWTDANPRNVVTSAARSAVSVSELTVDDKVAAGDTPTQGNQDGRLDEGETVKLNLKLRNTGGAPSGAMTISLSVEPADLAPYVSILDGTESVAALAAGGTMNVPGAFRLKVLPNIPGGEYQNGDRVPFEAVIRITEPGRISTFIEPLPGYRPLLDINQGLLTELAGGDGDNVPDNGETMLWRPVFYNYGSGTAANLEGVLSNVSGATVVNGYDIFPLGSAPQGSTMTTSGQNAFRFVVTDASDLEVRLKVRSAFDPAVTFLDRQLEFGSPAAPVFPEDRPLQSTKDAILLAWTAPADTDVRGYVLERSTNEGGPYLAVLTNLLKEMSFYRDTGLSGLTRYYYRVAAVDNSGNWSAYSDPISATTNPAILAGWPFTVTAEPNWGAPTIENIDKTGNSEIFFSADRIYGLRSDGVEIIDGDGLPSTPGVWSSQGSYYWSKPAIADINGDGIVEIVGAARYKGSDDTGRGLLSVWRSDGTLLWQKTVGQSNFLIASPVLADIAGDAKLEVIAQNRGVLYAWNSDGTPVLSSNTDGRLVYVGGGNPDDPLTYPYAYGSPAVGNLDSEGKDEIVFALGTNDANSPSRLIVIDGDGQILATTVLEQGIAGDKGACNSSPALADVNTDGKYEIFITSRNYLYSYRYQTTEPRGLFQNWSRRIDEQPTNWLEATPAIGDVDGANSYDVVIGMGLGRVTAVNAQTGVPLSGYPKSIAGTTAKLGSAILVNLDSDGPAEIVIGDTDGIVHAFNGDTEGTPVAGFPYAIGGRIINGLAYWDIDKDHHPNLLLQSQQLPQITILDIQTVDFPLTLEQAMVANPWTSFRHDARNTGRIDAKVVTPVMTVQMTAAATSGAAILSWSTPAPAAAFRIEKKGPTGAWEVRAEGESSQFEDGGGYTYRDTVEPGRHTYRLYGYGTEGETLFQSGEVSVTVLPYHLAFTGIVPNPFRGTTAVRYQSPAGSMRLDVLDLGGRRIRTLFQGTFRGGVAETTWDGKDDRGHEVASGVYLARLTGAGGTKTEKLVLLR